MLRKASAGKRDGALDLLESAGWPRPVLVEWASSATVLELYDPADDEPRGAAIVDVVDESTYELRAWASTLDTPAPAVWERLLTRAGFARAVATVLDAPSPGHIGTLVVVAQT